jgi:uroporphyrinogen-III synthase
MQSFATQQAPPRVLVTRPAAQAATWVNDLAQHGVDAVALPLIDIVPLADEAQLHAAWAALARYKLVMFVSPNAAAQFFATQAPTSWPRHVLAASPGPGTSASLRAFGVPADCIMEPASDAPQFDSEALWQRLQQLDWREAKVLVVAGQGGRDWLAQQLKHCGAQVESLIVYRRAPAQWTPQALALAEQALSDPSNHLWFFSSSEAVAQLLQRFSPPSWIRSQALATHPRIAQTASDAGFSKVVTCRANFDAVLACIQSASVHGVTHCLLSTTPTHPQ